MTHHILLLHETNLKLAESVDASSERNFCIHQHELETETLVSCVDKTDPDTLVVSCFALSSNLLTTLETVISLSNIPVILHSIEKDEYLFPESMRMGIPVCITGKFPIDRFSQLLDIAETRAKIHMLQRQQTQSLQIELDSRRRIERAKYILMHLYEISEDNAYHQLRHLAMNSNRRIVDIANDVIRLSDNNFSKNTCPETIDP